MPDMPSLEIRLLTQQGGVYPVEMTLGETQQVFRGQLAGDIAARNATGDSRTDGQTLFNALFASADLMRGWGTAHGRAKQVRVQLRIDALELHALPWELLRDDQDLLAADADTPFSRYLAVSQAWGRPITERPIRGLAVIANPKDIEEKYGLPRMDVAMEARTLEPHPPTPSPDSGSTNQESPTGRLRTGSGDWLGVRWTLLPEPITLERLEAELRNGYHLLHFIGHGAFSARTQQASLYLQDARGNAQRVTDEDFAGMLNRLAAPPHLVVLAACQSATQSTKAAFSGLGPKLVQIGVPAVVAMQENVTVLTARQFAATFYQRLLAHGTVDLAMNEARGTLIAQGRFDAAVPVLFMRLPDGQLWDTPLSAQANSHAADIERQRQRAVAVIAAFRRAVINMDLEQAKSTLRELSEPETVASAAPDIDLAHRIYRLMLADTATNIVELIRQSDEWPDECVAAYLMCYQRLYEMIPGVLRKAKDLLPATTNSRLRLELERATLAWPNMQPLRWPVIKLRVPNDDNPFQHEQAEDDRAALFGKPQFDRRPAYWPNHPLFRELCRTDRPQLIMSVTGSGQTAMSLALGKYGLAGQARLSLYLPNQLTSDAIIAGYARLFLDFAQTYPTRLSRLNAEDRVVLARLLNVGLGKDYVLAEIKAAQLAVSTGSEWQTLSDAQFNLLAQQVERMTTSSVGEYEWPRQVVHSARVLGFDSAPVLLVVDTDQPDVDGLQHVLAQVERWNIDGVVTLIFVSRTAETQVERWPVPQRELEWSPRDFRSMLNHRYRNLKGLLRSLENEFDNETAFSVLLECSGNNPRRFIRLWNACQRERAASEVLTADLIRAVWTRLDMA